MVIIITVHSPNEQLFLNNGIAVLSDTINCLITEELNGVFELELTYPIDSRSKWQYLVEENIIRADGQPFRIYRKKKNLTSVSVNARHIYYDLMQNFLEDVRPTNATGSAALDWILTHTQYAHNFTNMSDVGGNNTKYFIRQNPVNAIMGEDGIIANWGGELVRDNFQIKLLGARGLDRGVLISYRKNIQGIEETLDEDGICTRLMPLGKDALMLPEKYIDSQYIGNYPHPKIKTHDFDIGVDEELGIDEADAIVLLRAAATSYMVNGKIDIPQFNYVINFLELSKTEEYKNYSVLERVYLGDTVTVRHSRLNLDLKAKVIKTTKNVLTGRLEKVELGSFKPNIATGIDNAIQDVRQEIINGKSEWQKAVDNATNLINSSLGGFVVKKAGELLIMDTEDEATATKVWRWNLNGLGYSSTGYSGPYALAMTMDGAIVASFVSGLLGEFVQLRANQIILGTLGEQIPDGLIRGSEEWNNAVQKGASYNQTTIDEDGLIVSDLSGGEVVTVGEMGYLSNLYGIMVKNALGAAVVRMGKIATGLYGIRADHTDGSYTQLTQNGLERFVAGESYPYMYETYVVAGTTVGISNSDWIDTSDPQYDTDLIAWNNGIYILLPARFQGKDFKLFLTMKSLEIPIANEGGTVRMRFEISWFDKPSGIVNVVGYAYDNAFGLYMYQGIDFNLIATL